MTPHQRRIFAAPLVAAAACGMAVGCSSAAGHAPKPTITRASPSPSLPAFPVLPQQQVLIEAAQRTGASTFTTKSLKSTSITLQAGCVGPATAAMSVQVYQGGATPIYEISKQPCGGGIQKIDFTAEGIKSMTVKAQVSSGGQYSLLMTQG